MKRIIIAIVLLIIVAIYISTEGISELKESYTKTLKRGGGNALEPAFEKTEYYDLNVVWEDEKSTDFKYKDITVVGSDICNLYTYENFYSTDILTDDGSVNTLLNDQFSSPSLENVFEDLVNGKCHLTEISELRKSEKCIDVDQIYAVRSSRKCKDDDSSNKCIDSNGLETKPSETENYNSTCSERLCEGDIGCISLNYFSTRFNINEETRCISIKRIKVPPSVYTSRTSSFYLKLGIFEKDESLEESDAYPIEFDFKICNTIDPKQKFKIVRYNFEEGKPVYSKVGSYTAIIFRGLNMYLDMGKEQTDDGNKNEDLGPGKFVLRKFTNITESIKWIFMPPVEITRKTIPSAQRCIFLRSNVEVKGIGVDDATKEGAATGTAIASYFVVPLPILNVLVGLFTSAALSTEVSYLEPPVTSVPVPVGSRVAPTNFMGEISARSKGTEGLANNVRIEKFCIPRELENYPPYFLQSLTNEELIEPGYINYGLERGGTIVIRGLLDGVMGIFLWKKKDNIDINKLDPSFTNGSISKFFRDKNTIWQIYEGNNIFIESIGFPTEYFEGGTKGVVVPIEMISQLDNPTINNDYETSTVGITGLEYIGDLEAEQNRSVIEVNPTGASQSGVETETEGGEQGSGCTLNIVIGTKPTTSEKSVRILKNFSISNPGSGYKEVIPPVEESYHIKAINNADLEVGNEFSFPLKFKVTSATNSRYLFKTLVKRTEGFYRLPSPEDYEDDTVAGGFGLVLESNLNTGQENTGNQFNFQILNRGFNYEVDKIYYLAQYDIVTGEVIFPKETDLEANGTDQTIGELNLLEIKVTQLSEPSYKFNQFAPHVLLKEGTDLNMSYNFMDNSLNEFENRFINNMESIRKTKT